MPINEVMPESAPIEAEEYSEGTLQTETAQAPEPSAPPPPVQEPGPPPVPQKEPPKEGEADPEPDDEPDEADKKASEAGRELAERKKGLEGRKLTVQEQINALVRERGEVTRDTERGRQERATLQREIETLRGERERLAGRTAVPEHGQAPEYDGSDPRDPEPVEGSFEDYAAYTKAIGRWAGRQEFRRGEFLRYQREQQAARQQWETTRQQSYSTRYQAYAQAEPTFEQEINREDLVLTEPVVDVIKDSEVGPQILLHLARHPEELERINAIALGDRTRRIAPSLVLAFGEMKKLEARLEGAHSGSPPPVAQHSKAPAPIKPVANASSRRSDTDEIPGEDIDMDEHIERMNKRDEVLRKRGMNPRKGYGLRV